MVSAADQASARLRLESDVTAICSFRDLPEKILAAMRQISFQVRYPAGAVLFAEGEPPRGVFQILSGRIKVFICSGDGRALITRLASEGDVLGLPGTLSGRQYEVTTETLGPVEVAFIKRDTFLRFLHDHQEVCLAVVYQLTRMYTSACHEIRCLGLTHNAGERLAQLLLQWPLTNGDLPSRFSFAFRHEDVAQMIGTSRETVSRVLAELKKKESAELHGATLHIRDRAALQALAAGKPLITVFDDPRRRGKRRRTRSAPGVSRAYDDSDFHIDGV